MSRKIMPLGPLSFDIEAHLRPIGEFYICTDFKEEVVRPPVVMIGENIYYRFMHYLYLPEGPGPDPTGYLRYSRYRPRGE